MRVRSGFKNVLDLLGVGASLLLLIPSTPAGGTVGTPGVGAAWANFASQYSNLGPCNRTFVRECYADSAAHNWDYDLGPNMLTATYGTLYGSYDTTDLTISLNDAGNNGSHNGYVDVYYDMAQVPDNAFAITDCVTVASGRPKYCDHWHVDYDPDALDPIQDNSNQLKSIACHETGHSVGLTHQWMNGGESMLDESWHCMRSDENFPSTLGGHNVDHINWFYS